MSDKIFTGLQIPNLTTGQARNPDAGFLRLYAKNGELYGVLPAGTDTRLTGDDFNDLASIGLGAAIDGAFLKYSTGTSQWTNALITTTDISNFDITAPSIGQVLKFNGTNWINDTDLTGGAGGSLTDLSDVTITTPTTGEAVIYNGTTWVNQPISITESQITDLGVYLTTETDPVFSASPASGILAQDIINWDAAFGWNDHALAGYLLDITGQSIQNLQDVGTFTPTDKQVLTYNIVSGLWEALDSTGYVFVWAEAGGNFTAGGGAQGFQWGFGASAGSTHGITAPTVTTARKLTLSADTATTATVELYINRLATGLTVSLVGTTTAVANIDAPIAEGDEITFRTTAGTGGGNATAAVGLLLGDVTVTAADGLSAYEIALQQGFVGTEQEWLDSLSQTATNLTTPRNISLSGDVTGSTLFDGSQDVTITATVADNSHLHSIANVTGLQTELDGKQPVGTYLTSETDPVVGAVNGIVKSNGLGFITAAVLGIDYSNFNGQYTSLTGAPTDVSFFNNDSNYISSVLLNEVSDVTITSPTVGQVLKYNGTIWINDIDATGGGGLTSINEIPDVVITTPTSGQVLKYNGTAWVNDTDLTGSGGLATIGDIPDVTLTTPTSGDALTYNGVEWVNQPISITESQITDLQAYLTTELNDLTANVTWASVPDTFITQTSVQQYQSVLQISEVQITDLQAYLTNETVTSLSLSTNILTYTDENGIPTNLDLSLYLDDTNLSRIVGGTLDGVTGIATFTRDDATSFTVDFGAFLGGAAPANFKTYMTTNATVNDSAVDVQINVFNPVPAINAGGFIVAASGVTVPSTGVYQVMGNMNYTSASRDANVAFSFAINGVKQPEEGKSSYISTTRGHNESSASMTTLFSLTAGQEISLQFREEAGAGAVTLQPSSFVALYKVD